MLRFSSPTLNNEQLYAQALKAKSYARDIIRISRTAPEENAKEPRYKHAHNTCIQQMRLIAIHMWEDPLQLETDLRVLEFEAFIKASAKYSIGNCSELCMHVLDYYLTNDVENRTRVELFCLANPSDHVFVVINRKRNSDEDNPHTWGKQALICDPLMNMVYPAIKYKDNLMDFEYNLQKNTYIPFNEAEHHLQSIPGFSTDYLNENRQPQQLVERLQQKLTLLLNTLQTHHVSLETVQAQLSKAYCTRIEINQLLTRKMQTLTLQMKTIQDHLTQLQLKMIVTKNYRDSYAKLHLLFEEAYIKALDSIRFTPQEVAIITQHPNTSLGKFFGLFHQKSPAFTAIKKALAQCQLNLETQVLTRPGFFNGGT